MFLFVIHQINVANPHTVHQLLLLSTNLSEWALGDERIGLLGQNKEGLTSFPGMSSQVFILIGLVADIEH